MWVWAVFGLAALCIWLLIAGAARLYTRFEYTKKSLWGLYICAAAALGIGLRLASATGLPTVFAIPAGLGAAAALFVVLASVMTHVWLSLKIARYDRTIEQLLDREYLEKAKLEDAREKVHGESLKRRQDAQRRRDMTERRGELMSVVDSWQQGGGIARVRSLKVEEWRTAYQTMDDLSLGAERERLKAEAQAAALSPDGFEQSRQLQAQLAVLDLTVIEKRLPALPKTAEIEGLFDEEERVKARLETIRADLSNWQRKRSEFLGRKIRLD